MNNQNRKGGVNETLVAVTASALTALYEAADEDNPDDRYCEGYVERLDSSRLRLDVDAGTGDIRGYHDDGTVYRFVRTLGQD